MGQIGSVYKQPETEVAIPVTAGGCQVSKGGHKGETKGNWQGGVKSKGNRAMYIQYIIVHVCSRMFGRLNDN